MQKKKNKKYTLDASKQKEFIKCKYDPIYFIEKYLKIFSQSEGTVYFKMYEKQKEFIRAFIDNHKVISFKSRQTGISTTMRQLALWLQLFYNHYNIGVLSLEQNKQNDFLKQVKEMYYTSDLSWLNLKVEKDIESLFRFNNNSSIRQGNSNNPFRSYSMSTIMVDEQQFIPNLKDQLMSVAPTLQRISNTGLPYGIILNSTQNGVDNYFYQIYSKQVNHEGGYYLFQFHWTEIPEYDDKWYKEQCEILDNDPKLIQQELDMKFIGSGDTFIKGDVLENVQDDVNSNEYEDIYFNDNRDYRISIYHKPESDKEYIIGVDPSGGMGNDYSAQVVIDKEEQRVQQIFKNNSIDDKEFSELLYQLGQYYNNQKLGIEMNGGFGISIIRRLLNELHYNNFYWNTPIKQTDLSNKKKKRRAKKEKLPGIINSQITRPLIINNMQKYIYNDYSIVESKELAQELLVFVHNGKKIEQRYGYHDDLVMQFQHSLWVRENDLNSNIQNLIKKDDEDNNILQKIVFVERETLQKNNTDTMNEDIDYNNLSQKTKKRIKMIDKLNF